MIKWIVSGQPRMALFAGDKPIMTGDELTYDYNFDPFSAKNVQKCLCGQPNCRGVLGPKPKGVKPPPKEIIGKGKGKGKGRGGKRKFKDLSGNEENQDPNNKAKKRKILDKPKPIRTLKAVKALKVIKGPKVKKALKPAKVAKPGKTLKSIKVVKQKVTKTAKATKDAKGTKTAKPRKTLQPANAKTTKRPYSKVSIKLVKSPTATKGQRKQRESTTITVSGAASGISVSV
jgi:histone-lysine N-methyltransferase ASH1L